MARIVGAEVSEVVVMNTLTVNLHLMMVNFYRPTSTKYKILIESKAFPSDIHAVVSQITHHGYDPIAGLITVGPREGEDTILLEDIEQILETEGDSIALVLFSGIQYYTGQLFPMERLVSIAKSKKCMIGFDLAHAVGNVPLQLHNWNCDFACWCSYKYLNCGPGSIGGCFVHEKHTKTITNNESEPILSDTRFAGWWGHRLKDRFNMAAEFIPEEGAYGFRLSNPSVLLIAGMRASLDVFDKVLSQCNLLFCTFTYV